MKKEYFNIPNLMGYFRIILIPVFYCFITGQIRWWNTGWHFL